MGPPASKPYRHREPKQSIAPVLQQRTHTSRTQEKSNTLAEPDPHTCPAGAYWDRVAWRAMDSFGVQPSMSTVPLTNLPTPAAPHTKQAGNGTKIEVYSSALNNSPKFRSVCGGGHREIVAARVGIEQPTDRSFFRSPHERADVCNIYICTTFFSTPREAPNPARKLFRLLCKQPDVTEPRPKEAPGYSSEARSCYVPTKTQQKAQTLAFTTDDDSQSITITPSPSPPLTVLLSPHQSTPAATCYIPHPQAQASPVYAPQAYGEPRIRHVLVQPPCPACLAGPRARLEAPGRVDLRSGDSKRYLSPEGPSKRGPVWREMGVGGYVQHQQKKCGELIFCIAVYRGTC